LDQKQKDLEADIIKREQEKRERERKIEVEAEADFLK
jgi:hypothetical protein